MADRLDQSSMQAGQSAADPSSRLLEDIRHYREHHKQLQATSDRLGIDLLKLTFSDTRLSAQSDLESTIGSLNYPDLQTIEKYFHQRRDKQLPEVIENNNYLPSQLKSKLLAEINRPLSEGDARAASEESSMAQKDAQMTALFFGFTNDLTAIDRLRSMYQYMDGPGDGGLIKLQEAASAEAGAKELEMQAKLKQLSREELVALCGLYRDNKGKDLVPAVENEILLRKFCR